MNFCELKGKEKFSSYNYNDETVMIEGLLLTPYLTQKGDIEHHTDLCITR